MFPKGCCGRCPPPSPAPHPNPKLACQPFRNRLVPALQELRIGPQACNYTLWDLPAAQRLCAPAYNESQEGLTQQLPLFEVPPTSHFAVAEAAAEEAFTKFRQALKPGG